MSSSTGPIVPFLVAQPLRSRALLWYGAAVALPLVTLLLRLAFWEYVPVLPFGTFIPSVALLAVFGGAGPAVVASVVSAVLGLAYLAVPEPFEPGSYAVWVGLGIFVIVCAILVVAARQFTNLAAKAVEAAKISAAARESVLHAKLEAAELVAARGAAERRLEQVTDALPVLISQVGRDGRFEFVNKAYEEWFGRNRETLKGATLRRFWALICFHE